MWVRAPHIGKTSWLNSISYCAVTYHHRCHNCMITFEMFEFLYSSGVHPENICIHLFDFHNENSACTQKLPPIVASVIATGTSYTKQLKNSIIGIYGVFLFSWNSVLHLNDNFTTDAPIVIYDMISRSISISISCLFNFFIKAYWHMFLVLNEKFIFYANRQ